MHEITLRPASQTDAHFAFIVEEQAMRHHAEATWGKWTPGEDPERYIKEFNPLGQQVVVASTIDAGVLAYEFKDDCIYISKLYLLEKYRGAGLGAQLLEDVLALARKTGKSTRLHTLTANTRAVSFYEKHGFAIESQDAERIHMVASAA